MATKAKALATTSTKTRIESINDLITQGAAGSIDGVLIDIFSAGTYKAVHKGLTEEHQKKLDSLPIARAINICFTLINKQS